MPARDMTLVAALVLVASSQETFLAAVLPSVLPGLGVGWTIWSRRVAS